MCAPSHRSASAEATCRVMLSCLSVCHGTCGNHAEQTLFPLPCAHLQGPEQSPNPQRPAPPAPPAASVQSQLQPQQLQEQSVSGGPGLVGETERAMAMSAVADITVLPFRILPPEPAQLQRDATAQEAQSRADAAIMRAGWPLCVACMLLC